MNLAQTLVDTAREHGEAPAVKLDDAVLPYAGLEQAAARVAALLQARGVEPGDRVGIMLPNVPYFPMAYYGALWAGAVAVPMNVLLKGREVGFYLRDSGARLLLAWHGFADAAREGAEAADAELLIVEPGVIEQEVVKHEPLAEVAGREGSDTAVLLYTSGTTGSPKGAELSHDNLRRNAQVSGTIHTMQGGDVILGALPLFHSFGQTCCMNAAVQRGACLTLLPRFDPGKAIEMFGRDGVTIFMGVPTMYGALLHHPSHEEADLSTLRVAVSGGASLPLELLRAFEEAFDCLILEGYGLSETSPVASFNHSAEDRKPGSIGTPIEGVELRVVDDEDGEVPRGEVGEIVIRGHNVMKGYWNNPEATAEALRGGWFHSGDMATEDEDGYFFIVDRKKDMILRGGYNVYPREVEEVLYEHPAVREAAVVGIPHDELGEEVGAAVALKEGETVDADALRDFVRERLAAYKYPRRVWFVDELPKGPTGKILKREIRVPAPA